MGPQQQSKHQQLQAQAKQRIRQQQLPTEQSTPIKVEPKLPTLPPGVKANVPAKPLFEVLKPPATASCIQQEHH